MKHYSYIAAVLLLAFCLLTPTLVSAGEAEEIKARMLDRLPLINQYKAEGIAGEDNQGYLLVLGIAGEWTEVVAAENADRRLVYEAIAAKTGATVASVGARRALQIRESAAPGTWLQSDDGKWAKK
jgi:hypothetical protein